jgi:hypothetical protein
MTTKTGSIPESFRSMMASKCRSAAESIGAAYGKTSRRPDTRIKAKIASNTPALRGPPFDLIRRIIIARKRELTAFWSAQNPAQK